MNIKGIGVLIAGCLIASGGAHASALPGFSITYASSDFLATPSFTLGYAFTTNTTLRLNALGVFDYGQDGLKDSHAVGLYNSYGGLIVSTTIASGTTSMLHDDFRYASVTPITLAANETYYLGALYASNADDYITSPSSITSIPGLTYQYGTFGGAADGGAVLTAPLTAAVDRFDGSPINYFGPNLMVSAVPLPDAFPLFGLGLLCLGFIRLRRTRPLSLERD